MMLMDEVPALTDWLTGSQVADRLGVSRNTVNKMMHSGKFKTLRALGERPIFVVRDTEVDEILKARPA